jgi:hypothetical protein
MLLLRASRWRLKSLELEMRLRGGVSPGCVFGLRKVAFIAGQNGCFKGVSNIDDFRLSPVIALASGRVQECFRGGDFYLGEGLGSVVS